MKGINAVKRFATAGALALVASPAFAAVDLTGVTIDVSTVEQYAGIVLLGLAAIWAIRKLIKLSNRS